MKRIGLYLIWISAAAALIVIVVAASHYLSDVSSVH